MVPQPLHVRMTVGRFAVHLLQAGGQRLDGGAMFGVVPKPLWERRIPADERNRIQLGMRCMLIEHDDGLVLIDTGAGNKESDKFIDIYGIENRSAERATMLQDALAAAGYTTADVRIVINTHLHFDHAGGDTTIDPSGAVRITFQNAQHYVQKGEYDYAMHPNERTAASYFARNWEPIVAAGRFTFVSGEQQIVPGIRVRPTPGHTPHHQSVLVDGVGEIACFLGDVMPTSAHVPLPWIMGYDVEPLVTLESKRALLREAAADHWLLVFEHDATIAAGRVTPAEKGYTFTAQS
jgi:glyoxylase-like metal-dependent hydrolase (beta-lactamase superfamily II)